MRFEKLEIVQSFLIYPNVLQDERGVFVKTFEINEYLKNHVQLDFAEEYYSYSKQKVLRGIHVQLDPCAAGKLIYCIQGEILDFSIDLRQDSKSYLTEQVLSLSAENKLMLYIPPHVGHGFYTVSQDAIVVCKATKSYAPDYEKAIHWSSFQFPWPDASPIVSSKDRQAMMLKEFISMYQT
jgi:dTDP-4-dehydrorhamnose 3,5-epimerase